MAKIYPQIEDDFHSSYGESRIFESLKKLSDDWYVYHSLNWKDRSSNGRITWGEADFVIFHKTYGILIIEVKSGGISFEDGRWYQTRLDNNVTVDMKNPFKQADRSKYKLIDEIDYKLPYGDRCFIDKAVWFPSITKNDLDLINLPMEYDKRLILTKDSLNNPLNELLSVYNFYNSSRQTILSNETKNKVLDIIVPNFNLIPSASNIKDEADYIFYQLTNEQKKVLNFIEDQQTVAIQGAAGTGKTFIAVEAAKKIAEAGKVLFLCFNKYLYLHLNTKCSTANVEYYNLHTFLSKNSSTDLSTTEKCINALEEIDFDKFNYTSIIIDEAQDINEKILDYIYNIAIEKNIKLILFYDKNQMIYQNVLPNCINDFDCKLSLKRNCRNTTKILYTINSTFNSNIIPNDLSVSGVMPTFYFESNNVDMKIEHIIDDYIQQGYDISDITILTLETEEKSILKNKLNVGKYKISDSRNDCIFFTSSKKFKGLESNIVIVIDFDAEKFNDYEYKKNLYVSLSRARQRLSIISNNMDDLRILSNNIEGNFEDKVKVARKFKMKIDI